MFRNRKIKVRYFPRPKIEDTHHCATPLLENKIENIILYLGTNDALQSILIKKLEKKKEKKEVFTNRLKKQGITYVLIYITHYITHNNIIHKHLRRDGLHLNLVGFTIFVTNFVSYSEKLTSD